MKKVTVTGEIMDELDLVSTLEQENRQLHARNQRLERELEIANDNGIEQLKDKLDLQDGDRFEAFRVAVRAVGECFKGKETKGVMLIERGDKVSIIAMNADMADIIEMTGGACERMLEIHDDLTDKERVLN